MKTIYKILICVVFTLFTRAEVKAQCPITAGASSTTINCGDVVKLSATGTPGNYIFKEDFNTTCPGAGWIGSSSADCSNPCGAAPGGASDDYLWFSSASTAPRNVTTKSYDITTGGTICFDLRYAQEEPQEGCPAVGACNCEGPDLSGEGVSVQYSPDGGVTWTTMQYFDPNGGHDPNLVNWNNHCCNIPSGGMTANTRFRFIQENSTDANADHWGINNVVITTNDPDYKFDWTHDGIAPAVSANTPDVQPATNTVYTVTLSNSAGTSTCVASVAVNVVLPTATATVNPNTVCAGATVSLDVQTSYKPISPTVCALSAQNTCNSFNSQAGEYQIGAGNSVNSGGNCNENILGVSNCGGALRSQILYRASELIALGMKPGKITSMQLEVATIAAGSSYTNFRIKMGCTNVMQLQTFGGSNFEPGVNAVVFTPKTKTVSVGWNTFSFDNYYDWDGVSNIIVEICYVLNSAENRTYTRNTPTAYPAVSTAGTNSAGTSGYDCNSYTSFFDGYNFRPNTKFATCEAKNVTLTYTWTGGNLSSTSAQSPTAVVNTSGNYIVTVYPTGAPQCKTTQTVAVTATVPTVNASASNTTVCPPTPSFTTLDANGSSQGNASASPVTFRSSTNGQAFANNAPAGTSKTITVSGMSPTTLAANPIVSVCANVTATNMGETRLTLVSPGGASTVIYDGEVTGANFVNTCFATGAGAIGGAAPYSGTYAPTNAFPTGGNVNGVWTLTAADVANPVVGNIAGGTFNSWTITFRYTGTNQLMTYTWSPTTGLSDPYAKSPKATPSTTTTYTVTATDAIGCTTTSKVLIGYCMPVSLDLLSFTGKLIAKKSHLNWATANEKDLSHFILEKAAGLASFSELAKIPAKGKGGNTTNYSFIDAQPFAGLNYYRLKMVDVNGESSYSQAVSLNLNDLNPWQIVSVHPIPVNNELSIDLSGEIPEQLDITIHAVDGKLISSIHESGLQKDARLLKLDVSALAAGVYFLKLSSLDGKEEIKRFVK